MFGAIVKKFRVCIIYNFAQKQYVEIVNPDYTP